MERLPPNHREQTLEAHFVTRNSHSSTLLKSQVLSRCLKQNSHERMIHMTDSHHESRRSSVATSLRHTQLSELHSAQIPTRQSMSQAKLPLEDDSCVRSPPLFALSPFQQARDRITESKRWKLSSSHTTLRAPICSNPNSSADVSSKTAMRG